MRAVIQVVTHASVEVNKTIIGACNQGYVILLGIGQDDTKAEADLLWKKLHSLRIFADENGKSNRSICDVSGQVLVVSQFTLYADCKKGTRPSFTQAAKPDSAKELYNYFVSLVQHDVQHVQTGQFGAHMHLSLACDGPFTIVLDTDQL